MLKKIITGLAASLMLVLPTLAQDATSTAPVRLAFVQNDALYALEPGAETPVLVDDTPNTSYAAVWSPDGSKLAYLVSADGTPYSSTKTLRVWDGTQSIDVVSNINATLGLPINWTRDGKLVYSVQTDAMNEQDLLTEVYTVEPTAGAAPQLVSNQIPFGVGCGGASSYPFDHALWEETDLGGSRPLIQLTDFGLVYTSSCAGGRTALFRTFSNEFVPFSEGTMVRPVLASDQWHIAGVSREMAGNVAFEEGTPQILTVDLETGEETALPTAHPVSQVTIGGDGSYYYSSVNVSGNVLEGLTEEQLRTVSTVIGIPSDTSAMTDLPRHTVSIYRRLDDGTETTIVENLDAYDVGRMQVIGDTLYFSTISNPDAWVQAILDGTVTFENTFDVSSGFVSTDIYSVDINTPAAPTLVIEGASQFTAAGA